MITCFFLVCVLLLGQMKWLLQRHPVLLLLLLLF
jgi:hypothetical protein